MSLLGAMVMSAPRHDGTDEARDGNAESVGVLLHFVDMVVANGAQDVFQVRLFETTPYKHDFRQCLL